MEGRKEQRERGISYLCGGKTHKGRPCLLAINELNHHQQKMAEIIHGRRHRELVQKELDEMRAEIGHLRSTIATQALALEGTPGAVNAGLDLI